MSAQYRTDPEAQALAHEAWTLMSKGKYKRTADEEARLSEIQRIFGDHAESAITNLRALNKLR